MENMFLLMFIQTTITNVLSLNQKKKVIKAQPKNKKIEVKKNKEVFKEKDYSEEENIISNDNSSNDIFKDDTLESLKSEIEVETTDKKDNKLIYIIVGLGVVGLIFFLNN